MRLTFPYPVSANRYWRHVPNKKTGLGMHFRSDEAKAYVRSVGWIAKAAGFKQPTDKPIEIASITLHRRIYNPDGKKAGSQLDLTNCWKIAEDALQGIVYVNDKQIQRLACIEYGEPTDHGALVIEIVEFIPKPLPLFAGFPDDPASREIFRRVATEVPVERPRLDFGTEPF